MAQPCVHAVAHAVEVLSSHPCWPVEAKIAQKSVTDASHVSTTNATRLSYLVFLILATHPLFGLKPNKANHDGQRRDCVRQCLNARACVRDVSHTFIQVSGSIVKILTVRNFGVNVRTI